MADQSSLINEAALVSVLCAGKPGPECLPVLSRVNVAPDQTLRL